MVAATLTAFKPAV